MPEWFWPVASLATLLLALFGCYRTWRKEYNARCAAEDRLRALTGYKETTDAK